MCKNSHYENSKMERGRRMATAVICFIIAATAYLGVMTIGSIIWGITMLTDYLEVEKMFREGK